MIMPAFSLHRFRPLLRKKPGDLSMIPAAPDGSIIDIFSDPATQP
jgi:hypothetical protein